MIDVILEWDRELFHFLNTTLATPVGDALWPAITHYDRFLPVRVVLLLVWIMLVVKGGRRGRMAALLLVPVIVVSDQLNSHLIKELIGRPRPCHLINGVRIMGDIHMLVDCGPGFSFTSSHAVNNAAAATVLSWYYPRWTWAFVVWAGLVALSRVFVGVHYPLDLVSGAVIGACIAYLMIVAAERVAQVVARRRTDRRTEVPA
jgi:undecaprenyl-diphosphatase